MKAPRHASSIALLVVALAAGAWFWFVERDAPTDVERAERAANVFPIFHRDEVTRIELARAVETLVLERAAGIDGGEASWRITSPRNEEANPAAVDRLLRDLEGATRVRAVDGNGPGLDAPSVRGTIAMGKSTLRFALGNPAPTPGGGAYFRVDGAAPIVAKKELVDALLETPDAYRVRALVAYASSQIARVEVRGDGGRGFVVERANEMDFRLPDSALRASRAAMDRVWSALGEARAEAFIDDGDADRATATPALVVTVSPKDAARPRVELAIGGACAGHPDDVVVVRKSPAPRVSACAPKVIVPSLSMTRDELVDTLLFAAREDEVGELRIDAPSSRERAIDLARAGSGWHERAPVDRMLTLDETEAADALVRALARSRGADPKHEDFTVQPAVAARVTFVRVEPRREEVIELLASAAGADAKSERLVRRVDDGAVLRVPIDVARRLEPRPIALRARSLFAIESAPIESVATQCRGVAQDFVHDGSGWTMRAPSGQRADVAGVLDLANELARAKAEAWIAESDDGSFGFERATCSVTVTARVDAAAHRIGIVFGGETEGGVYAHALGEGTVFVAPRALFEMTRRILVDRAAISIDVSELATLVVSRGATRVIVTKLNDRLAVSGDAAVSTPGRADASSDPAARVEAALEALRADAVAHLGAALKEERFDAPSLELRATFARDAGAPRHLVFGALTALGDTKDAAYFARADGVDATFVIAKSKVLPLLDVLPR